MNKNIKWMILAGIVLIVFSMQSQPKESVAAIDGQQCAKDADCPCWGKYNFTSITPPENATAYGLGVASCNIPAGQSEGTCDMTWCVDIQPVGQWAKDNPWAWIKDNAFMTIGIIIVLVGLFMWPRQ